VTDVQTLDLRPLPHGGRHQLVFATILALKPGEAVEIINDHDPKPLSYMLAAEHPGQFGWTYVEEGPDDWRVRIDRLPAEAAVGR
jgi:uncharacterized protein (DUF2249 family)